MAAVSVTPQPDVAGHVIEPQGISPPSHALSEIATVTQRAERAEDRLELVLSERDRQAEEQLRVMLMKLEATNAELAGALVQKALPPAPEEAPRRTRWWQLWR